MREGVYVGEARLPFTAGAFSFLFSGKNIFVSEPFLSSFVSFLSAMTVRRRRDRLHVTR
jgi:hypothetical protein